jgi:hypothetical protein
MNIKRGRYNLKNILTMSYSDVYYYIENDNIEIFNFDFNSELQKNDSSRYPSK